MIISEEKLSHIENTFRLTVEKHQQKLEEGGHDPSNLPYSLDDAGNCSIEQAQAASLLGKQEEAKDAYASAAEYKRDSVQAMEDHWEEIDQELWEDAPALYTQAMFLALISRDDELITEIASEALELDDFYLDLFASEYEDSPYRFYHMKVLAATILSDDRLNELLDALKAEVEMMTPVSAKQFGETLNEVRVTIYELLRQEDSGGVVSALEEYLNRHATVTPLSTEDPDELIDNELIALCLLANDRGIDVTVDSPYVPDVLVPNPAKTIHVIDVY
ncbi:immunity 49 family protein [Halogeometricum borinquense]|uniref:Immunity 49 family protein n=1 Tax=Halogeometricum borinquense TaxID=60847 RepID=A0A6C0UHW1_9EURY|nr:immunity 49 family protein [Halogeometricum borinquense]QIB74797.1 immunity 49 family protein [Halogeometricum borinquense]